jgi:tRNA (guanine-N7-)-methyltransferase
MNFLSDPPLSSVRTDDLVRLELPEAARALDLPAIFGNERPVELEIGIGKGRFIVLAAAAYPEVNFLGVEYAKRYLAQGVERAGKRGFTNVRLAHAEAAAFVRERLADGALDAVHLYFPDPWPKKRHHKRRFVQPGNLDQLARVMKPGALFRAVTDHPGYAQWIAQHLARHGAFADAGVEQALWNLPGMGDHTAAGVTNFEIKYRREGRPIHRFAWVRK